MRKIIETLSTLFLWAVWFIGSGFAISEFLSSAVTYKKITHHLWVISWSPAIALTIFMVMMLAIRKSKHESTKKSIPCLHSVQWSEAELSQVQTGKIIDLHFASPGLDCNVTAREAMALVSHSEQQTLHVTVAPPMEEPLGAILQNAF